jgi:hypothetical protein
LTKSCLPEEKDNEWLYIVDRSRYNFY